MFAAQWVSEHEEESPLPGFESMTPQQMFWVSWGQVWCSKYRDAALKKQGGNTQRYWDISPTFKLILILNTLSSLESDKDNFKELGYSITLLKTATDRDWSALAGEVQDSRALVKQRGLCEGLQLSGGIPHEPREEVQSVVAHQGSRKCDTLKKEWESRSESEVWCGSSVIWSKLKVQKLQPLSLREKQIIILIMCHFKNYCTWCHEKLYWLEQHCAPTPSPSEVEL